MSPEHTDSSWSSELLGPVATEAEAHRWGKLVSALEKLTADAAAAGLPLPEPLEAWAKWVVPVGRLSFETGRTVVTLTSPSSPLWDWRTTRCTSSRLAPVNTGK
jgi:hypothetical protein